MNTFLVDSLILEWSELMMGGKEHTVWEASNTTGYTGESRMICKNLPKLRSFFGYKQAMSHCSSSLKESSYLVEFHQAVTIHFLGLIERNELDVLGSQSFVRERTFNGIQIMSTHGGQCSLSKCHMTIPVNPLYLPLYKHTVPANVVVKFILKIDEAGVVGWCESDVTKDGTDNIRTDLRSLYIPKTGSVSSRYINLYKSCLLQV